MIGNACCSPKDRHLPTFVMDNFVRRLISPPEKKVSRFVTPGIVTADIGCGPGYFTVPIAERVGASGKVYAADADPKSIDALKAKMSARGLQNIVEAQTTSAASLKFIPDQSIDFAFANDVLCCMVDHRGAIDEIKRILKPHGLCYLSVTKLYRKRDPRAVTKEEWHQILEGFDVQETGEGVMNRWATFLKH
jgi:ubiquinone/menaquinone biosynthesis C-methylase UbiE